ncbi:putative SET and MYND domain-containing protein [Paratrimastix pyriformis]|uniref:SET and MYND domain-containing protein n=1 Tax=Paratrimastix pyriformis TaxID=342808 RepID=A0ABQ8UHS7_9EUKA|nr:putative SET and MYND domain-containing protein [Paratrimastix pyriformis]
MRAMMLLDQIYYGSIDAGPEHIDTAPGYFHMANAFRICKKEDVASAMYEKVVDIWYNFLSRALDHMAAQNERDQQQQRQRDDQATAAAAAAAAAGAPPGSPEGPAAPAAGPEGEEGKEPAAAKKEEFVLGGPLGIFCSGVLSILVEETQIAETLDILTRILHHREERYGPGNPLTGNLHRVLGMLYIYANAPREARSHLEQAHQIYMRELGDQDPNFRSKPSEGVRGVLRRGQDVYRGVSYKRSYKPGPSKIQAYAGPMREGPSDFQAGELVFEEEPLLFVDAPPKFICDLARGPPLLSPMSLNDIHAFVTSSPEVRAKVMLLFHPNPLPSNEMHTQCVARYKKTFTRCEVTEQELLVVLSIFDLNCHHFSQKQGGEGHALFELGSKCTHSCLPNAVFITSPDNRKMQFRSVRPIHTGDILTTSYLTSDNRSVEYRRLMLEQNRQFHCRCPRCTRLPDLPRALPCPHCAGPFTNLESGLPMLTSSASLGRCPDLGFIVPHPVPDPAAPAGPGGSLEPILGPEPARWEWRCDRCGGLFDVAALPRLNRVVALEELLARKISRYDALLMQLGFDCRVARSLFAAATRILGPRHWVTAVMLHILADAAMSARYQDKAWESLDGHMEVLEQLLAYYRGADLDMAPLRGVFLATAQALLEDDQGPVARLLLEAILPSALLAAGPEHPHTSQIADALARCPPERAASLTDLRPHPLPMPISRFSRATGVPAELRGELKEELEAALAAKELGRAIKQAQGAEKASAAQTQDGDQQQQQHRRRRRR